MLRRLRERAQAEQGFTLIELLVVILIIGILAAIAIPSFLNQKQKGQDAQAKSQATLAAIAMETCQTEDDGSYAACNTARMQGINPETADPPAATVTANAAASFTVSSTSTSGAVFTITKNNGATTRSANW